MRRLLVAIDGSENSHHPHARERACGQMVVMAMATGRIGETSGAARF
jgi:hypothetical protein